MRTWLKRMVAGIVSAGTLMGGGLLMAGTANADEIRMPDIGKTITSLTASAATTYPRELVNGGLRIPPEGGWNASPANTSRRSPASTRQPQPVDQQRAAGRRPRQMGPTSPADWSTTRFGWSSTQTGRAPWLRHSRANAVELQKATGEGPPRCGELSRKPETAPRSTRTSPRDARHAVYTDRARPREPLQHPTLTRCRSWQARPATSGPSTMTRTSSQQVRRQDRREVHHHRHALDQPVRQPVQQGRLQPPTSASYTIPAGHVRQPGSRSAQVSGVNTTSGNLLDNIVVHPARTNSSYDRNVRTRRPARPRTTPPTVKPAETDGRCRRGGVEATVADTNATPCRAIWSMVISNTCPTADGRPLTRQAT